MTVTINETSCEQRSNIDLRTCSKNLVLPFGLIGSRHVLIVGSIGGEGNRTPSTKANVAHIPNWPICIKLND